MALQIEFEIQGTDQGTLEVRGLPIVGSEILVAVQRLADEHYLTMHGRWDPAANWYPCPCLDADATMARFTAGAALTLGLRGAGQEPLRAHLRHRDFSACAPLVVRAPAAPRVAAANPVPSDAPPAAPPLRPEPSAARQASDAPPAPVASAPRCARAPLESATTRSSTDSGSAAANRAPARGRIGAWTALSALGIAGLAALIWWSTATRITDPTAPSSPAPALAGKALAAALQGQNLPPADLFARAERANQADDCEAAIRLFVAAAKRDPAFADALARRYDLANRQPSPCFTAPKPDSAMTWYLSAAQAGIPTAQRRYAELLLDEAGAGPLYRDAIEWLRKAAAAGDAAAATRLRTLGER